MIKKILIFLTLFLLITGVLLWFNSVWLKLVFASSGGNDSYTVSLLHMDGTDGSTTFTDSAAGGTHTWTANGNAQIDTAQSYFGGASGLFDGTGDYLSAPDSDDWNFGSGDFTIDGWVRFNTLSANYRHTIVGQWGAPKSWWVFYDAAPTATLYFGYSTDGSFQDFITVSWTASINTWYHLTVVRNGNNLYFFVDGTQVGATQNVTGITVYDSTVNLNVGAHSGGSNFLDGWLDELRVSKGIARWTANFTPPASAYSTLKRLIIY